MSATHIELEGVRVHNLKNISLKIRRNALTVICGVSGSGKSSLAFDTLFAEGQRRYVETFSPYARQFLDRIERPAADRIDGIPPAIAIRQNAGRSGSRSTVGSRTEILDYLRILFARTGNVVCPDCEQPVQTMTADSSVRELLHVAADRRAMICFRSNADADNIHGLLKSGFTRGIVSGKTVSLEEFVSRSAPDWPDELLIVVDRIRISDDAAARLTESIEQALELGNDRCMVLSECPEHAGRDDCLPVASVSATSADGLSEKELLSVDDRLWRIHPFSKSLVCRQCDREFSEPAAEMLNFRSVIGACPTCEGSGHVSAMTFEKVVPDDSRSLSAGAIEPWNVPAYRHELEELLALADDFGLPADRPFRELTAEHRRLIRDGVPERNFGGLQGFHRRLVRHRYKPGVSVFLNRWRSWISCPDCGGSRLNRDAAAIRLAGRTITQVAALELSDLADHLKPVISALPEDIAGGLAAVIGQLTNRLRFLLDCGLGYLSLDRAMRTLSGGEAQRVALTSALGSGLINTLYVLDEPTSGLHLTDTQNVIDAARRLQMSGNTVVVVEHDPDFIRSADEVIEIGPSAGLNGGQIVFQGTPEELAAVESTATGSQLRQRRL
ncbi:MAG: hypothetical protein KDA89_21100, partial [Planctomycetaceae bacterium]|nr:hypothetical protein [Planctomycetaceae bacterium]